jgi:hypothetical protein
MFCYWNIRKEERRRKIMPSALCYIYVESECDSYDQISLC